MLRPSIVLRWCRFLENAAIVSHSLRSHFEVFASEAICGNLQLKSYVFVSVRTPECSLQHFISLTQSSHSKCERESRIDFHRRTQSPKCERRLAEEILVIRSAWAIENCSIAGTGSVVRDVRILQDLWVSATGTTEPFSVWFRCHYHRDSSRKNHVFRMRTAPANSRMNRLRRILDGAWEESKINTLDDHSEFRETYFDAQY